MMTQPGWIVAAEDNGGMIWIWIVEISCEVVQVLRHVCTNVFTPEANHGGGGGYKLCFVQGTFFLNRPSWAIEFFCPPVFTKTLFQRVFCPNVWGNQKNNEAHLVTLCTWEKGNEKEMVVAQKNSHAVGNGSWRRELEGNMIFPIVTFITSYYLLHIMKLIDVVQVCLRKVVTSEFRRVYDICLAIVKYVAGMQRVWFAICNINLNQPMYDLMTWIILGRKVSLYLDYLVSLVT